MGGKPSAAAPAHAAVVHVHVNGLILRALKSLSCPWTPGILSFSSSRPKGSGHFRLRVQSRGHVKGAVTSACPAMPLNRLSGGCPRMARGTPEGMYARLPVHAKDNGLFRR
jgi:hypothetical protein